MDKVEATNLISLVEHASIGDTIIVDNLISCCDNIEELLYIVMEVYRKHIRVKSNAQPWFDNNSLNKEFPLVTIVKLHMLNNSIKKLHGINGSHI